MRSSVIIPNYNYGDYIGAAIDSALNQTVPFDEIIVVDDGSTDHSRDVISAYGDRITMVFQENAGQAAAISQGVAQSTGDILFLLDSDDVFAPHKHAHIRALYEGHPQIDWIFHDVAHCRQLEIIDFLQKEPGAAASSHRILDVRHAMQTTGKPGYSPPATSGLTFRRRLAEPIFPLPKAKSIYISDHYIKFFLIASAQGIHDEAELTAQTIHGSNLYTDTGSKLTLAKSRIFLTSCTELLKVAPHVRKFCNILFVVGVAYAIQHGIVKEMWPRIKAYAKRVRLVDWPSIIVRIAHHLVKH